MQDDVTNNVDEVEELLEFDSCSQCGSDFIAEDPLDLADFIIEEEEPIIEPYYTPTPTVQENINPYGKKFSSDIFFSKPLTIPTFTVASSKSDAAPVTGTSTGNSSARPSLSLCSLSASTSNSFPVLTSTVSSVNAHNFCQIFSSRTTSTSTTVSPTSDCLQSASNVLPGK